MRRLGDTVFRTRLRPTLGGPRPLPEDVRIVVELRPRSSTDGQTVSADGFAQSASARSAPASSAGAFGYGRQLSAASHGSPGSRSPCVRPVRTVAQPYQRLPPQDVHPLPRASRDPCCPVLQPMRSSGTSLDRPRVVVLAAIVALAWWHRLMLELFQRWE